MLLCFPQSITQPQQQRIMQSKMPIVPKWKVTAIKHVGLTIPSM